MAADEVAAARLQSRVRGTIARARVSTLRFNRYHFAVRLQHAWRHLYSRRAFDRAAIFMQAAARGASARLAVRQRFFTVKPLRTCGHGGAWKVGVGDLTKQMNILYNIGAAAGLTYVHTPLSVYNETLEKPHRGSTSVSDIDFDRFLGISIGERPRATLPAGIPVTLVHFHAGAGLSAAAQQLREACAPCLLVLIFSYELMNSPSSLSTLARHLGAPTMALRSRFRFGLSRKYCAARAGDGFSCGWRTGALRVVVHVRRGDRAWVELDGKLFCMHEGLWTRYSLGRSTNLDGVMSLSDAPPHAVESIRSRAPPASLFEDCFALVQRRIASEAPGAHLDVMIVSDGYEEEYYQGFGPRVDAAFAAKIDREWETLRGLPSSTLVVGNGELATQTAIDAMTTAHIVVIGGGSHLPDVCQRYLSKSPGVRVNAWEYREEIAAGQLPEHLKDSLSEAVRDWMRRRQTHGEKQDDEGQHMPMRDPQTEARQSGQTLVAAGHSVTAVRLRAEPRVAFLRGILTTDECAHIIRIATTGDRMHRSRVVQHSRAQPKMQVAPAMDQDWALETVGRTSQSCCVSAKEDAVVRRVVERAAWLVGLTVDHAEAAQVVHYLPGHEYRPHFDFYNPKGKLYRAGTAVQGNRLISVFAYLSACERGGCTAFPLLGLRFTPEIGCAVLWYNLDRDGRLDLSTLHAGEPVEAGEKYGMNIWFRERPRLRTGGPVRAHLSLIGAGGLVRVQLLPAGKRRRSELGIAPCTRCDDPVSPLGLCLCEEQYVDEGCMPVS